MFGTQIPRVSVDEITDDAYLLDIREDDEWQAGHAPGAWHVPMHQVPERIDEVPADQPVVVVCRSGMRSARVVQYLRNHGRDNVHNLDGGMRDWVAAGRPLVAENDAPAQVL